jgi:hypothetical protein
LIFQTALKLKNFMSDESRRDLDALSAMDESSAATFLALNVVAPETAHPVSVYILSPFEYIDIFSSLCSILFC